MLSEFLFYLKDIISLKEQTTFLFFAKGGSAYGRIHTSYNHANEGTRTAYL